MRRLLVPVLSLCAMLAAGCGGGGSATTPTGPPNSNVPVGPVAQNVTLYGNGYSLAFAVPPVTTGTTATMSATLGTALPHGVVAPSTWMRKPHTVGVPLNALVYLTVQTTASVGFASAPGFTFTLPAGTTIPAGSQAYLLYYDTYQSSAGWVTLLGPGTQSGQIVSFPSRPYGFTLKPNAQYVYALAITTQPAPTASPPPPPTPAPTPSTTPAPTPAPTSAPPAACPPPAAGTFPLAVTNNTGIASKLLVYAWGMTPASVLANNPTWVYLNDATSGTTTTLPASGQPIGSFTLPASGCINLPPLVSARVYFYFQTQNTGTGGIHSNGPASGMAAPVGTNASFADDIANVWDFAEYTWYGSGQAMTFDLTAVDGVGIPSTFYLQNGTTPLAGPFGLQPGMLSRSITQLQALGDPWQDLVERTATTGNGARWSRIVAPQDALGASAGTVSFDSSYMLVPPAGQIGQSLIDQIWNAYRAPNTLHLLYGTYEGWGTVDAQDNFNFYNPQNAPTPFATIPKPKSAADIFGNSGVFAPPGASINTLEMGRALSVNILRGTLPVPTPLPAGWPSYAQPFCGATDSQFFYHGYLTGAAVSPGTVMDWYSAIVHKNAVNGLLYGFPDDDECNSVTNPSLAAYAAVYQSTYAPGYQWSINLNPF